MSYEKYERFFLPNVKFINVGQTFCVASQDQLGPIVLWMIFKIAPSKANKMLKPLPLVMELSSNGTYFFKVDGSCV